MASVRVILVFMLILLSGCGFQLRGLAVSDTQPQYRLVNHSGETAFGERLAQTMARRHLLLSGSNDEAPALHVHSFDRLQRQLATDAQGRTVEWQMTIEVTISLGVSQYDGQQHDLQVSDKWSVDPDNVLAGSADIAQIKRGVEQEMINRIIQTLFTWQSNGN